MRGPSDMPCIAAAVATLFALPDLAALRPSSIVAFAILGVDGADHLAKQQEVMFFSSTPPTLFEPP